MSGISGVNSNYSNYGNYASGKRINSVADGAAELSIIEREKAQIGGLDKGKDNMESAKEALNISEGALGQITDSLQRMRELALQAKNGIYSDSDRQSIQDEVDELKQGINEMSNQADYNTKKLLDGSETEFDMAVDSKGTMKGFETVNGTLEALGLKDFDVTKDFNLEDIDNAIDKVLRARGSMGAQFNGFEYSIEYNANASYNLTGAESKLEDLDFSKAISDNKKNEVINNYSILMQKKKQEMEENKVKNFFA